MAGGKPSRRASEPTTSFGGRDTNTTRSATPQRSSTRCHNGSRRHRRGSLTAHSETPAKSRCTIATSASNAVCAAADASQLSGNGRGSSQVRSSAASKRSCTATTSACSQNPDGLSGPAGIRFSPNATPCRLSTRVNAEVPLRCIPSTNKATGETVTACIFFTLAMPQQYAGSIRLRYRRRERRSGLRHCWRSFERRHRR